jgi:hypothetical protein
MPGSGGIRRIPDFRPDRAAKPKINHDLLTIGCVYSI